MQDELFYIALALALNETLGLVLLSYDKNIPVTDDMVIRLRTINEEAKKLLGQ